MRQGRGAQHKQVIAIHGGVPLLRGHPHEGNMLHPSDTDNDNDAWPWWL